MTYKLGIFDWNGTLIDDSFANHAGSNATFQVAGRPPITMEEYRATMDFPLIHFYNRNGIDTDTYLSQSSTFNDAFMDVYKREQEKAGLRSGAMDVRPDLRNQICHDCQTILFDRTRHLPASCRMTTCHPSVKISP